MVIAPALDRHRPWISYQSLTTQLVSSPVETFDWTQSYGSIVWPRRGRSVLEVRARRPDYWKAEDLDAFDGRGWVLGSVLAPTNPLTGVSAASLRRWTQTLQVTLSAMESSDVIAAGVAFAPTNLQSPLLDGASPGTWVAQTGLSRGDSYRVRVYDPQPTAAQLAAAGTGYPAGILPGYLTLSIPQPGLTPANASLPTVETAMIAPFGSSPTADYGGTARTPDVVLGSSPYAAAYALARRLAGRARTPYAYVLSVERYLARGYTYSEDTNASRFPLESFLFATHAGYCQQFAGAMALLLRLGGVPARVAVGFTSGSYDSATKEWVVADNDAHAWVEVFFPHYGWIRFDPTPPADPALRGSPSAAPVSSGLPVTKPGLSGAGHRLTGLGSGTPGSSVRPHSAGWPETALLIGLALGLAGGLALAGLRLRPLESVEARVVELERAFARTGRPLAPGTTLTMLEHQMAGAPLARAYVHALVLQRFADVEMAPTTSQRRALRAELREGLGLSGAARAWWALPPRRDG